jgi:hypothetical protein
LFCPTCLSLFKMSAMSKRAISITVPPPQNIPIQPGKPLKVRALVSPLALMPLTPPAVNQSDHLPSSSLPEPHPKESSTTYPRGCHYKPAARYPIPEWPMDETRPQKAAPTSTTGGTTRSSKHTD